MKEESDKLMKVVVKVAVASAAAVEAVESLSSSKGKKGEQKQEQQEESLKIENEKIKERLEILIEQDKKIEQKNKRKQQKIKDDEKEEKMRKKQKKEKKLSTKESKSFKKPMFFIKQKKYIGEIKLLKSPLTISVGKIRVARVVGSKNQIYQKYLDYTNIILMNRTNRLKKSDGENFYELSSHFLRDSKNRILENVWQFSKVYTYTPKVMIHYSTNSNTIVWKYKKTQFLDENRSILLDEYFEWRKKGQENFLAVRNPVSCDNQQECIGAIKDTDLNLFKKHSIKEASHYLLDYVESKKQIYLQLYSELVETQEKFKQLKERHLSGENLMIIEQDEPSYIEAKYDDNNVIDQKSSIEATIDTLSLLVNDTRHSFGHEYCLAANLLGLVKELQK